MLKYIFKLLIKKINNSHCSNCKFKSERDEKKIYKYSFKIEEEIKSCDDCPIYISISSMGHVCCCLSQDREINYKELFVNCPLKLESEEK